MSTATDTTTATEQVATLIRYWLEDRDEFVLAVEAEKFTAFLHENHPDLLAAWHKEREVQWVTIEMNGLERRARATATKRRGSRAFADAVANAEAGDATDLGTFRVSYCVTEDNLRKRVADMTGEDHKFVADAYQQKGKFHLMLAAFHRAVAKQVGKARTADVMTEEQYASLLQSFSERLAS